MAKTDLTAERLRKILHYNAETGIFTWIAEAANRNNHVAGKRAGSVGNQGYRTIYIDQRYTYSEHRLVWLYEYGHFPPECIDHINGVRDDNRLANLRLATKSENAQNRSVKQDSKTGCIGVSVFKANGTFEAYIRVNKKKIHLGRYKTVEAAAEAYKNAKQYLHTFHGEVRA